MIKSLILALLIAWSALPLAGAAELGAEPQRQVLILLSMPPAFPARWQLLGRLRRGGRPIGPAAHCGIARPLLWPADGDRLADGGSGPGLLCHGCSRPDAARRCRQSP